MGYKRLYELTKNLYLSGSPVIIEAGALLKEEESGSLITQLKFKSIRSKRIISLKAAVRYFDTAGRALGDTVTASYLDLNSYAGSSFGSQTPVLVPYGDARSFTASVSEVIFADGSSWSDNGEWRALPEAEKLSDKLEDTELLKQYRLIKENAENTPMTAEDLWFCDCGCWNPKGEDYCYGCNKEIYRFEDIDLTELEKDKEERVKKELITRKKTLKISALSVLALIVVIILGTVISNYTEKNNLYKQAIQLREEPEGEYSFNKAIDYFTELENFKDSPEQIKKTEKAKEEYILAEDYSFAVDCYEDGAYDTAIECFGELGDYKDSKELLKEVKAAKREADYQEALGMLDKGRYWNDDAMEVFEELGDYKDSADRLADCQLREAIKDLDYNYFINNYESYTRVMGNEIVKAIAGDRYNVYENYREDKTSVLVTYYNNGKFEGEYPYDGIWGVHGDMMLFSTYVTRETMNEKPEAYGYVLYKVNDDVYIMCDVDKATKDADWSKIEYILVAAASPYAVFAEEY